MNGKDCTMTKAGQTDGKAIEREANALMDQTPTEVKDSMVANIGLEKTIQIFTYAAKTQKMMQEIEKSPSGGKG